MLQKPGLKLGIGIFLFVFLIAFIVSWQFYFKDRIDTVQVVVVKPGTEIAKKETIHAADLTIERRNRKDLINDYIPASEQQNIIGKDAAQIIPGNGMLSYKMIDYDNLIPNAKKGEAIRPIPHDWIYAMPGSLRRKDHVDIYVINKQDLANSPLQTGYSDQNNTKPTQKPLATGQKGTKDTKTDSKTQDTTVQNPSASFMTPILTNVSVVYAKDSSNNEVTSSNAKKDSAQTRLTATGQISELELILSDKQFEKLASAVVDDGAQLYFTYK